MKNKIMSLFIDLIISAIIIASVLLGIIIYEKAKEDTGIDLFSHDQNKQEVAFEPDYTEITPRKNTTEKNNIIVPQINVEEDPLIIKNSTSNQSSQTEDNNYENITLNKYFYNQLDKYSKVFYKAFESNKENMKTGTYKINLGSSFSDLLSKSNGQEQLQQYYQSAIEAYTYDNPDIFYLNPSKMYLNIETTTRGNKKTFDTYIDCGEGDNYLVDEFNSKENVDDALKKLETIKSNVLRNITGNVYKDVKMIHDYLINSIEYDQTVSKSNIYNIYGALVNNECVCEGYAESFKYLLDALGIDSVIVIGRAQDSQGNNENHAWNYVKINENWYAVDVTWDDPIIIGGGNASKESKYRYFLKSETTMNESHFPSGQFTQNGKVFEYPTLSVSDYR